MDNLQRHRSMMRWDGQWSQSYACLSKYCIALLLSKSINFITAAATLLQLILCFSKQRDLLPSLVLSYLSWLLGGTSRGSKDASLLLCVSSPLCGWGEGSNASCSFIQTIHCCYDEWDNHQEKERKVHGNDNMDDEQQILAAEQKCLDG